MHHMDDHQNAGSMYKDGGGRPVTSEISFGSILLNNIPVTSSAEHQAAVARGMNIFSCSAVPTSSTCSTAASSLESTPVHSPPSYNVATGQQNLLYENFSDALSSAEAGSSSVVVSVAGQQDGRAANVPVSTPSLIRLPIKQEHSYSLVISPSEKNSSAASATTSGVQRTIDRIVFRRNSPPNLLGGSIVVDSVKRGACLLISHASRYPRTSYF